MSAVVVVRRLLNGIYSYAFFAFMLAVLIDSHVKRRGVSGQYLAAWPYSTRPFGTLAMWSLQS